MCARIIAPTAAVISSAEVTSNTYTYLVKISLARLIFTKYVYVFEVTSALLITAAVGAMILAHIEKRKEDRVSQPERMLARFQPGNYPAPKPGPGVFSTSDSVATPARLPDGTPSDRSISKILPTRELTSSDGAPKGDAERHRTHT